MRASLRKLLSNYDEEQVSQAFNFFVERFVSIGKYEGSVYPQSVDALTKIKQLGQRIYLATSKTQPVATDILKHFGLHPYFDGIYGSPDDKDALIDQILTTESIKAADTLMVGDREHDLIAARKCSVRSVAVTYGYGSRDELRAAKPDYMFDTLDEFADSLAQVRPTSDS